MDGFGVSQDLAQIPHRPLQFSVLLQLTVALHFRLDTSGLLAYGWAKMKLKSEIPGRNRQVFP
jgi:hypothetical protein